MRDSDLRGTQDGKIQRIAPRRQGGPRPASFAQEQLWFLDQLVPGSPAYNIVDLIAMPGEHDAQAMKRALGEIVRRHEILRTAFSQADGDLMQVVSAEIDLAVQEIDLSSLGEDDRARERARVVREEVRRPFDLSRAPLLRTTVIHSSRQAHEVLLTIHHIVSDEWSMELIREEVRELYAAFSRGLPSPLPDLPVQYADFASWQRDRLQGEVLDEQIAYWKGELNGASTVLALPTDHPRPPRLSFRGATEPFALPATLLHRLKSIGRKEQATLFMVLEAGFAALLHRYTGQADILVGTSISGRTHTETERLIGCFLNSVVLRSRFEDALTFRSLLRQVRERALGASLHSDLPFQRLVATLAPGRDLSRSPLFQVMFILHDPDGVSRVSNVSDRRELETGTSKFDLTLCMSETDSGLEGLMEYSTDLFERETIHRLCRHYGILLGAIADDPDLLISRLSMLSDADRNQLLVEWNDTAVSWPGEDLCLPQLFEQQVRRAPDRVAVAFGRQALTYGELDCRANQLANHLVGLGVGPDVLVGLLVERSLDMVVSLLGILKAGGGYVPLDPTFPPDRLAYMVENSKVGALITHRNLDQTLRTLPSTVVRLDLDGDEIAKHPTEASRASGLHRHHLAYVLYTSGSTGMPKGVAIAHSAIVNFLLSMQREPGFGAEDTLLAVTTLSFDIAGLELYLPLVSGGKVVVASREDAADPRRLMERIRDSSCTMLQATPATWRMLIEAGWKGSSRLRALCGGEAMPPDLAQALLPRCAELWNMYGPTETTVWSTVHRITASEGQAPIGRPIANTQTYVLDAHRGLVPPGVVGELFIGGEGLARGYLHRPDLTRERFVPSPFAPGALLYRTGDLARWRPDGSLDCLGRTDHQVKVRGFRIELGEIEAALRGVPGVREVVVVAERQGTGEPRLVAYWVGEAERQDLYQRARSILAPYMVPSAYARLGAFPLTPSGKIDRKALPSPDAIQADSTQLLLPRNDREVLVASVWAEVLGVDSVGIDQDFFALGGTSLLAIRARGRLEQEAGVEIPLRAFFEGPTVATIAAGLGAKADPSEPIVVHMGRGEPGQPSLFLLLGIQLYQDLAVALRGIQPVVAMHVPVRYRPGEEASLSIQAIATRYVEQIRKVQSKGPYQLGGFCFGGLVAFEVARQLEASGEVVEKVAVLDGFLPSVYTTRPLARLHDLVVRYSSPAAWRRWLDRAPPPTSQEPSSDGLIDLDVTAPELLPLGHRLEEDLKPIRAHVMVARATSQSYRAGVRLPPDLGWSRFAGRVFTIDVPSDHVAMLRDPHAGALAARWAAVPPADSDSAS